MSMRIDWEAEFAERLAKLQTQGLLRRCSPVEAADGPLVRVNGRERINWCSNDYLGLSQHPEVRAAAAEAARTWGVGAGAARLLSGTTVLHEQLEQALAEWFAAPAALTFSSGYLANLGALGTLAGGETLVLMDRLSHASLVDAVRLCGARLQVFRHNDLGHLEHLLCRSAGNPRRLIVTEGVFSMDGDCAPVSELLALAERHDARIYLDDAHGAFVLNQGRGSAAGAPWDRLTVMATLGKALGTQGAVVLGTRARVDLLRNTARTFIYETAPAIPVIAASLRALRVLREEPGLPARLLDLCGAMAHGLSAQGLAARSAAHIQPVIIGASEAAAKVSAELLERGHWCPAIRPPTVRKGTARLRLSLTAAHTRAQASALLDALASVLGGADA